VEHYRDIAGEVTDTGDELVLEARPKLTKSLFHFPAQGFDLVVVWHFRGPP